MKSKSILEVVHETAKGLYDAGLMDIKTMHNFDVKCLPPVCKLSPKEIKKIWSELSSCHLAGKKFIRS
jgi:putative transcriptional regulator